jgi:hypothetical protein
MCEPRRLTTLRASTACCRDSFTFSLLFTRCMDSFRSGRGNYVCILGAFMSRSSSTGDLFCGIDNIETRWLLCNRPNSETEMKPCNLKTLDVIMCCLFSPTYIYIYIYFGGSVGNCGAVVERCLAGERRRNDWIKACFSDTLHTTNRTWSHGDWTRCSTVWNQCHAIEKRRCEWVVHEQITARKCS